MRVLACLLPALLLAACGERQTFDERFTQKSEELRKKAEALDANLSHGAGNDGAADGPDAENQVR